MTSTFFQFEWLTSSPNQRWCKIVSNYNRNIWRFHHQTQPKSTPIFFLQALSSHMIYIYIFRLYLHIQHKRFWSDSGFVGETIGRVRNLTNQSMADPNRPRVEGTALWEPSEEEFFCPKESGWCMKISRTLHGYPDGFVLLWWLMI